MSGALAMIYFMQLVQLLVNFFLTIAIGKALKELEKNAVQDNNQDV